VRARSRTPDTPVRTVTTSQRTSPSASTSRVPEDARSVDDSLDEAAQLRQLVLPRPVPGLLDFGIPPAPEGEPDPALAVCAFPLPMLLVASYTLQAKLANFRSLKQSQNRHFNDALMSNRAFRNPHLYATLVEFVDVDERATAFPKDVWDPTDVHVDWFSDRLGARNLLLYGVDHALAGALMPLHGAFFSLPGYATSSARSALGQLVLHLAVFGGLHFVSCLPLVHSRRPRLRRHCSMSTPRQRSRAGQMWLSQSSSPTTHAMHDYFITTTPLVWNSCDMVLLG